MKRLFLFTCITVCIAAVSPVSAQNVVVGTLFDHSGALQDWGPRHQQAAELAAKQLAAAGLTIDFVHEDSRTMADAAKKAAEKLIQKDKVVAIIGSSSSGVIIPVAETVTSPANMLMITPGATAAYITELPQDADKDYLFRTCPSDNLQGVVLGRLAAGLFKTASVIYVNNPYGQGLARQFSRSFAKRGGYVYTMIPHGEEVADSYAQELSNAYSRMYTTKPFRSGRSDVLCVFSYPEHAKVYVKEAVEIYGADQFLFCDGSKSEELAAAVGPENVENTMGTAPGVPVGEAFLKFNADFTDIYKELPKIPFIANAYDAAAVIGLAAYAVKAKNQTLTTENIRNQLREVAGPPGAFVGPGEFKKAFKLLSQGQSVNYEGASGHVDFDRQGDVLSPIEVWRFNNGKISTYRMEYVVDQE
ncbi:MAG: ABC transporter substrate-binding protein [Desulfobacteraceae bacterium]|jgi:ABC-type branched-subunit amino acid transport system substrate-binding protein